MRKSIFVALIAISLMSIFFFVVRDDTAIPEERQVAQQHQELTLPEVSPQPEDEQASNTESDIQVSDEGTIVINWYEPQDRKFLFPNGTPLENYEYYKVLAESGFGIASYQLANLMSSCSHAYLRRDELDEAIVQMRRTSTYYDPKRDATVRIGEPEFIEEYVLGKIAHFESCKDFTTEQRDESDRWMKLAANQGYTTAMLDYGLQLSDPQESVELYKAAWELGDGGALGILAEGMEQVYDQGIDPTAKVPAYVAMHAYVTLLRSAYGDDVERVTGRLTLRNQAKLDEMAREMMPDELEAAVEQSRELITENKNCCYSM